MIKIRQKGDFSRTTKYFGRLKDGINIKDLDKFGQEGVAALASATPIDTGETARSWTYSIYTKKDSVSIVFKNSNIVDGAPIAILLQYGHGTRNGGYIQGRDYINPAIQPIFDKIADNAWKEVTKP